MPVSQHPTQTRYYKLQGIRYISVNEHPSNFARQLMAPVTGTGSIESFLHIITSSRQSVRVTQNGSNA